MAALAATAAGCKEPKPLPMPCLSPPPAPCAGEYVAFVERESTLTEAQRAHLAHFATKALAARYRVSLGAGFAVRIARDTTQEVIPKLPPEEQAALADARRATVRDALIAAGMAADMVISSKAPLREYGHSETDGPAGVGSGTVFFECTMYLPP